MVGVRVAVYTGIIERGRAATQPREDTPMTTNQNDKVPMLDEQLDAAVGGAVAIPAFIRYCALADHVTSGADTVLAQANQSPNLALS
jgi:hypothetical protein